MVRSSTSDEHNPPAASNDTQVGFETTQSDGMSVEVDSSPHRVDDRFRLLVNLLLHKVVERTLHDGGEFNLESFDGSDRGDSVVSS